MKKFALIGLFAISMASCSQMGNLANLLAPSNSEVVSALRSILNASSFKAVETLVNVSQNGAEALLPANVRPAVETLRTLGLGNQVDALTGAVEKAAVVSLGETQGIMEDAIKSLSFTDAVAVVTGGPNAATDVLKNAMYQSVNKRYASKLDTELNKTDAYRYWPQAQSAYNLFAKNKIEGDLPDLVSKVVVDELFKNMGKEEADFRSNYGVLKNPTVNKVFDYYTKK